MKKIMSIFGVAAPILGMIVLVWGTTARAETFGKTDIGGSDNVLSGNYKEGSKYTLSENGSVTKGYIYTKDNSGSFNCKFVIYNVDGDTASTLVATSDEVVVDTLGWYMFTFDPAVDLSAGEYMLAWIHSDYFFYKYYDAGTTGQGEQNADTYADGPSDPFGNSAKTDRAYSIYCEYTPSGGEESTPARRRRELLSVDTNNGELCDTMQTHSYGPFVYNVESGLQRGDFR